MNKFFLVFVYLGLFEFLAVAQNTQLYIDISPELSQVEQTVYWFYGNGNELSILDSAVISKEHSKIILNANLDKENYRAMSWLTFAKEGPSRMLFYPTAGEKMHVYVSEGTDFLTPKVEGCLASMEIYAYKNVYIRIREKIEALQDTLSFTTDSLLTRQYMDSIDYYDHYRKEVIPIEIAAKTKSPYIFHLQILLLQDYLPPHRIDSLIVEMKKRFPENKKIQSYPKELAAKASANSVRVKNRLDEIMRQRANSSSPKATPAPKTVRKVVDVKKVQVGDVVQDLSYEGLTGTRFPLREISTPYILLDFWASWCGPCRIKFPEMKKVLAANRDSLTVYAITLDTSEKAWQESIRYSHLEEFVNVMPKGAEADTVKAMFGIEVIPHNVLLDRERKIVATNIYGTDLIMKLKE